MIKTVWSTHYKCWVAIDDVDILNQKKGISEANAIARAKYAATRSHFKLTKADIEAMKAACTPPSS